MGVLDSHRYFQEVFETYAKDIFRYVYTRLSDKGLSEDVTSEVFVKFWKKIQGHLHIQNERALLYTIAHGLVIDEYRKKSKNTISLDEVDQSVFAKEDTTAQQLEQKEDVDYLYNKLMTVKAEYREALLLYYVEEMSIDDIALILGKKEGTVRVLVHRALTALRKTYE